ncbi:MAG: hypothetical protein JKY55_04025 [Aliivibrio sp.]|uniref:hypothetical protein n=1 Tax=Aliivibrio sp. TaxID=1872443 RepID=UPI001A451F5D|nr:hypothetical protein [Aliivibrio sp.]
MNYLAACLNGDGGLVRDKSTNEIKTAQLGDHESKDLAIENACVQLECDHVTNGVIIRGHNKGGYMVIDTQEFSEL